MFVLHTTPLRVWGWAAVATLVARVRGGGYLPSVMKVNFNPIERRGNTAWSDGTRVEQEPTWKIKKINIFLALASCVLATSMFKQSRGSSGSRQTFARNETRDGRFQGHVGTARPGATKKYRLRTCSVCELAYFALRSTPFR